MRAPFTANEASVEVTWQSETLCAMGKLKFLAALVEEEAVRCL